MLSVQMVDFIFFGFVCIVALSSVYYLFVNHGHYEINEDENSEKMGDFTHVNNMKIIDCPNIEDGNVTIDYKQINQISKQGIFYLVWDKRKFVSFYTCKRNFDDSHNMLFNEKYVAWRKADDNPPSVLFFTNPKVKVVISPNGNNDVYPVFRAFVNEIERNGWETFDIS